MIGSKIDGLDNVKGWAQKFEQGLHNATGARIGQDTNADEALASHNNNRKGLHFDGFRARIIGDLKKNVEVQDDASIALALQLQLEDEVALRKEQEEAASLRLIAELEAEDRRTYRF